MVAVAATCLIAALAAPTAGAAGKHSSNASASAAKKSMKKSARRVGKAKAGSAVTKKRLARSIRTINRRSLSNRRGIRTLRASLATLGTDLRKAINDGDGAIRGEIAGIVGVVTPVLQRLGQGLLDLQAALEGPISQAFADIEAGFGEVEAGFAEVEAALTDIGAFLGASENGFLQIALSDDTLNGADAGTELDLVPGCFYESADIPDTAQGLILAGSCRIPTTATAPSTIHFLTGIRSAENDGLNNDSDDPVGEAGIVWYEQRAADGSLAGGGATGPGGDGAPAVAVPNASELTPEGVPFPFSIVPTDDPINLSTTQFTGTPGSPTLTAAGNVVNFTLRFTDLSATADDPEA
jgi:hypothetical protein